ncbi:hypothetical protein NKDENANG_02856 [Candidatus Entotheonellaceae bacterium PAL068K]
MNPLNQHYRLTQRIDASPTAELGYDAFGEATPGNGFLPIGEAGACFTGSLDGNDQTIDALSLNRADTAGLFGLFGCMASKAESFDLGLTTVELSGDGRTSGLVGRQSGGTIRNCYASGNINSSGGAEGLGRTGGLVAHQTSGTIRNSYATGTVSDASAILLDPTFWRACRHRDMFYLLTGDQDSSQRDDLKARESGR